MNILVAGAGYLGLPLAISLRTQGHEVTGWVASEKSSEALSSSGLKFVCGDLADAAVWKKSPTLWDAIFYCASTSGGDGNAYQKVHGEGLANALQYLAPSGRIFYTSSTSVYGQNDGSDVTESSPTLPQAESSRILLEAEQKVLQRQGQVLRLAGIYGPERCMYLKKMREGRAVISGDGSRWVNQIHRDDAISAILFLWAREDGGQIWNVSDDGPVSVEKLYRWIFAETGLPMPERGGVEPPRKRGVTNKRVSNGKLRQAGWVPEYPTFREGYRGLV